MAFYYPRMSSTSFPCPQYSETLDRPSSQTLLSDAGPSHMIQITLISKLLLIHLELIPTQGLCLGHKLFQEHQLGDLRRPRTSSGSGTQLKAGFSGGSLSSLSLLLQETVSISCEGHGDDCAELLTTHQVLQRGSSLWPLLFGM